MAASGLTVLAQGQTPGGADAGWWKAAEDSIDRHRRSNLTLDVRDPAGFPVGGLEIEVRLVRHEFQFGTVIDGALVASGDADGERYRAVLAGLFNGATAGPELDWGAVEADPGPALKTIDWLADRASPVRGAGLFAWGASAPPVVPRDVPELLANPAAFGRRVEGYLTNLLGRVGGRVTEWEVLLPAEEASNGLTRNSVAAWIGFARRLDPGAAFGVGQTGVFGPGGSEVALGLRQAADQMATLGVPIDFLALQVPGSGPALSPGELTGRMDAASGVYSATGAYPLRLTGFEADGSDEAAQAARVREVLTAAFAHPSVTAIHASGFWEGRHPRPGNALFRRDWTPKPAALAWSNLVHQVWTTRTNTRALPNGRAMLRAFRGELEVMVKMPGTNVVSRVRLGRSGTARVTVPPMVPAITVTPGELFEYTWPRTANGYRLEVTTDPVAGPWQPVEGFALPSGDRWRVQLPGPDATEYYRLHRAGRE